MCAWLLEVEVVITDEAMVTAGAVLVVAMGAEPTVVGPSGPGGPGPIKDDIPMGEDRALPLPMGPAGIGCPFEAITVPDGPFRPAECGDRTVNESVLGDARGELDTMGGR